MLKKILKVTTFVIVVLVTLIAALVVEENIRGKAAWNRHMRELEAKGDTLDILKIAPPQVPDAQNLAVTPLFAELMTATNQGQTRLAVALKNLVPQGQVTGDWQLGRCTDLAQLRQAYSNENLLAALAPAAAALKEVADAAASHSQCRFPIQYEKGFECLLPHASGFLKVSKVLRVRALAELRAGQTDAAFHDVQLLLRLSHALENEPLLISLLVRNASITQTFQPIWEGLAEYRWNEEQLKKLQQELAEINLLAHLDLAIHGERCMAKWCLDRLLADPKMLRELTTMNGEPSKSYGGPWNLIPSSFVYFNCLNVELFYQRHILGSFDSKAGWIDPARVGSADGASIPRGWAAFPYHVLESLLVPAISSVVLKVGVAQTAVQNAMLACALERYRLANGRLPEKLDALVPQFIAAVPRDVIDGQPLRYRLDGNAGFVLYSIGWNQKDDGGVVGLIKPTSPDAKPRVDDKQGDWIWRSKPAQ